MKRIIDIPDELYKKIMGHRALTKYQEHIDYENLKDMIEDSTPLNGCQAEDFIKYVKDNYGIELTLKESDNPDTYEKLFGECQAEDCISRENLQITLSEKCNGNPNYRINYHNLKSLINKMPSVYPKSETVTEFADRCRECGKMRSVYPKSDNSVLEDIKAEIERNMILICHEDEVDMTNYFNNGLEKALEIIEKHISGKENHD